MHSDDDRRDQRLLLEVRQITHEYAALHRRTARDLARVRAELAHAHQVLGTVAHDLRTPLTAVLGLVELLLDDEDLSDWQRELGDRVDRAARSMTTLTDELVQAVAVGGSPLRSTPVNLSQVVVNVVIRHQELHPARGVRVVVDPDAYPDLPTVVLGDEAKLERLLDNLISNAVKFSPEGGYVRVSVTDDGRHAQIRVCDEGPGVPPDQLEAIFEPFHRAPAAASVPGVGLGLGIVRQIAERHGGRVHVESVPGAGATFVVQVPLAGAQGDAAG